MTRLAPVLALLVLATSASAQGQCIEHAKVHASLTEKFGETVQFIGLAGWGDMMEIYVNQKTGTWTILMTRPDGVACMAGSGQHWTTDAPGDPT